MRGVVRRIGLPKRKGFILVRSRFKYIIERFENDKYTKVITDPFEY